MAAAGSAGEAVVASCKATGDDFDLLPAREMDLIGARKSGGPVLLLSLCNVVCSGLMGRPRPPAGPRNGPHWCAALPREACLPACLVWTVNVTLYV